MVIVWWMRINETTHQLDEVESVFDNMDQSSEFFEKEIETGLVYDVVAMSEGPGPEEYGAFAEFVKQYEYLYEPEYSVLIREKRHA